MQEPPVRKQGCCFWHNRTFQRIYSGSTERCRCIKLVVGQSARSMTLFKKFVLCLCHAPYGRLSHNAHFKWPSCQSGCTASPSQQLAGVTWPFGMWLVGMQASKTIEKLLDHTLTLYSNKLHYLNHVVEVFIIPDYYDSLSIKSTCLSPLNLRISITLLPSKIVWPTFHIWLKLTKKE